MYFSLRSIFLLLIVTLTTALGPSNSIVVMPGAIGPYLNGVFPSSTPGVGGAWELIDPMPNQFFNHPVRVVSITGTEDILVLTKGAELWRVNLADEASEQVLDLSSRCFNMGDGGATGLALHPKFGDPAHPDKQVAFLYYRTKPDPTTWDEKGYNRLSKIRWDVSTQKFLPESEEVLIEQFDGRTWHDGGALFFGPDEMLYISIGDEGIEGQEMLSTQRLDGGLFSGILRIDIDNDPSRSHPIRRQPQEFRSRPDGWPPTFTQGYSIPNDNPWLSPEGEHLEEFFAIGLRSPYGMSYSAEEDLIYVADVGAGLMEEIDRIRKGDNLQWPFFEGTTESEDYEMPANLIGNNQEPYVALDRQLSSCIIGGSVYQGEVFPELRGKYIFADFNSDRLMALNNTGSQSEPEVEILLNDLGGQQVDMPEGEAISGVFPLEDGQIIITIMGSRSTSVPGKLFLLKRSNDVDDPPVRLSELGVFEDLASLTPIPGIIPYATNSPLWSDGALKKRWLAVPNDGVYDSPEEQITFSGRGEWDFPAGTVFIKHFEMPTQLGESGQTIRLETRFFVIGEEKRYGLTYRWNDEGTEAFLLGGGASKSFDILDENGAFAYTQTWDFPSRTQCLTCHNANANYVLGVKTHQLNGDYTYPSTGRTVNQLNYLNNLGIFHENIGVSSQYMKSYHITDENADLQLRVRSYLDANCSSCHRPGGLPAVTMDLRYETPLFLQNLVNFNTNSNASPFGGLIVQPGDHSRSELWVRDASEEINRMPPLATSIVDEVYVEKLAEWIDGLPADFGITNETLIFPNPASDWLGVRIRDDWTGPFSITLHSLDGKLMQQHEMEEHIKYVQVSFIPRGVYLLSIVTEGERQVERIVIQ